MKLTFIGACRQVTGSLHLLEACGLNIIIDCGLEQGNNIYENAPMPVKFSEIDYIILTHAHIDHAGRIPFACKNGFNGTVLASNATCALSEIMLRDSAYIQIQDAEWKNRKAQRAGLPMVKPLYDLNDAANALDHFRGIHYNELVELGDGVSIRLVDAGHLLGSASVEVFLEEDGVSRKLVFSGDIGNPGKPLIRNPQYIEEADYVIMESTYGGRHHEPSIDHLGDLVEITQRTLDRGGNVVFPAFAVGRTQELLYLFRQIKAEKLVRNHDNFPVYVDSPLAVEATHVFTRELEECYNDSTRELVEKGINPISFRGLNLSITLDESKRINFDEEPKVIISASGMCDAGRIRHHIKHNVWRPESTIVFAGYQAEGTLGRLLLDGAESVRLFGEDFSVRAEIATMASMSSHADQEGLFKWVSAFRKKPEKVFLVHGNDDSMEAFSKLLSEEAGMEAECPCSGSVFDLKSGTWLVQAAPVPYVREERIEAAAQAAADGRKSAGQAGGIGRRRKVSDAAYERLMSVYEKLRDAVKANYGGTNKDLQRFANQLQSLYDKWIR